MYRYLWYFVIYSFLGWCLEVTYKSFEEKRFINRGFLIGPYCPIYGFSSVCLIYCLSDFFGQTIKTSSSSNCINKFYRIFNRLYIGKDI